MQTARSAWRHSPGTPYPPLIFVPQPLSFLYEGLADLIVRMVVQVLGKMAELMQHFIVFVALPDHVLFHPLADRSHKRRLLKRKIERLFLF